MDIIILNLPWVRKLERFNNKFPLEFINHCAIKHFKSPEENIQ